MRDETSIILGFLAEIGIQLREGSVSDDSFLPGIEVENGALIVDPSKLKHPGDLLHEAGHLAVAPSDLRSTMSGGVKIPGELSSSIEVMAMLWSYAACVHLGLDPATVFHNDGYHGQASGLLRNYQLGVYLGIQRLEDTGMTLSPLEADRLGRTPFPVMEKWIRD